MSTLHASILKTLWKTPQSLADLQRTTPVSLPTLRKAIQELTNERWIRVVGQADANGGRPAMLFGIDETRYFLVGVHIQLPGLLLITTDLNGLVIHEECFFEGVRPTPNEVIEAIQSYVSKIRAIYPDKEFVGMGIATPGYTHPVTGDIISVGRVTGWDDFPICQRLQNSLGLPVVIANDVDCLAFAEFYESGKSSADNLVYVGFDEGVKISMFLNGSLYKGSFGNAGLIRDRFLNFPSVDALDYDLHDLLNISGVNHILEAQIAALPESEQAHYAELIALSHRRRLKRILQHTKSDMPVCDTIRQQINMVLAAAIANIVYIIQPDHVVIGGMLSAMSVSDFNMLVDLIRGYLPDLFANHVEIQQSQYHSANTSAIGAIYHLIDDLMFAE